MHFRRSARAAELGGRPEWVGRRNSHSGPGVPPSPFSARRPANRGMVTGRSHPTENHRPVQNGPCLRFPEEAQVTPRNRLSCLPGISDIHCEWSWKAWVETKSPLTLEEGRFLRSRVRKRPGKCTGRNQSGGSSVPRAHFRTHPLVASVGIVSGGGDGPATRILTRCGGQRHLARRRHLERSAGSRARKAIAASPDCGRPPCG